MKKESVVNLVVGVGMGLLLVVVSGCSDGSKSTHGFSATTQEVGGEGGDVEANFSLGMQDGMGEDTAPESESSGDAETTEQAFCAAYATTCGAWEGETSCQEWWESIPVGVAGEEAVSQSCYWAQLELALDADSVVAKELACIGAVGDSPPCVEEG